MTRDPNSIPPLFTHVDVSASSVPSGSTGDATDDTNLLLRHLLAAQDRQNELLEELVEQMGTAQKQRANELGQWKQANPQLARRCRRAAESLSKVQTRFIETLAEEVTENAEHLIDGEFMLNEFVDRFGPRLAHLNGVLQMLSQLSAPQNGGNSQQ
jgi:hypothetical protein